MGLLDDYGAFLRGRPKLPGFPPLRSPADEERGRANIRTILEGKDIAGGSDPPELKGLNLFPGPKQQDQLGPRPDVVATDVADTFSAKPLGSPPAPFRPGQFDGGVATAFAKPFDSSRLDPVMASTVSPSTPTRTAAPAFPPSRPAGIDAPTRTAAL